MTPKPAGFNPNDPELKNDLVIAGGDVFDPSQKLRGKRDIPIKNGHNLQRSLRRLSAC